MRQPLLRVAIACTVVGAMPAMDDFRAAHEDAWYRHERSRERQQQNDHLTYHRERQGLIVSSITDAIRVMPGIRMPARITDPWGNRTFLSYEQYTTVWDRNTPFLDTPSLPNISRSRDYRRPWSEVRLTSQQNIARKWLNLELSLPWNSYGLDADDDGQGSDSFGQPEIDLVFNLMRYRFQNLSILFGTTMDLDLSTFDMDENILNGGGWGGHIGLRHSFSTGRFMLMSSLDGTYFWEGENTLDDLGDDYDIGFERFKIRAAVGGSYRFARQFRSGASLQLLYDRWDDIEGLDDGRDLGTVDTLTIPFRVFLEWNPTLRYALQANVGFNPFEEGDHDDGGGDIIYGLSVGATF